MRKRELKKALRKAEYDKDGFECALRAKELECERLSQKLRLANAKSDNQEKIIADLQDRIKEENIRNVELNADINNANRSIRKLLEDRKIIMRGIEALHKDVNRRKNELNEKIKSLTKLKTVLFQNIATLSNALEEAIKGQSNLAQQNSELFGRLQVYERLVYAKREDFEKDSANTNYEIIEEQNPETGELVTHKSFD